MISKFQKISKRYMRHRYHMLFYSLLLTFVAAPLLAILDLSVHLLQIFLGINLAAALLSGHRLQSSNLLGVFMGVLLLAYALASIFDHIFLAHAVLALLGILAFGTVITTVKSSLHHDQITDETIFAALSAYLLAGLCMGFLYWCIEGIYPGSFSMADSLGQVPFSIATAIYFSFVTLATLGYGDILPVTELTRGLVILECVAGQLYLVVMVARLVSLYQVHPEDK